MKKNRWLSYFIVLAISLTMIPKPVSAEGETTHNLSTEGNITISSAGTYSITQNDPNISTTNTITVNVNSGEVYIILNGVNIDVSETDEKCAFKIADNSQASVTVELADGTTNILKSGDYCAGLQKNGTVDDIGTLTITGTGTLEATGGDWGAGIGGGGFDNSGVNKITIESGKVIAKGGGYAAGIGGGHEGSGSSIKIENGTVEATGGISGAGIGGGSERSGSSITIFGGTVEATGGDGGAGIGGGNNGSGSSIKIEKGTVIAKGGKFAAGIGGGIRESGRNITISGEKVIAKGGEYAAGIGGGDEGSGSSIMISEGTVTATGGASGAGIGGGNKGSGNIITISGGTVTAIGGDGNFDEIIGESRIGNGIGSGALNTSSSNIEITGGSVKAIGGTGEYGDKANDIGATPTNGEQTVYLAKLENQDGVNNVTVDGKTYTRQGNHPDNDTAFYLYLTGEDHTIVSGTNYYKATWNNGENNFEIKNKAPTPIVSIKETTASSITVNELPNQDIYGKMECSIDGYNWITGNILTNLHSANYDGSNYTVYAKYKGNDDYLASDIGKSENVKTAPASYTISIPSTTLTAGDDGSAGTISINTNKNFDLGYNGHVDVKVANSTSFSNGKLVLTRQYDTKTTITSALLVNGSALGDINKNVATFKTKDDSGVSISFAKPTESNIPAGNYQGTITFEVSYSEQ